MVIDGKGHFYDNAETILKNAENNRYQAKCKSIEENYNRKVSSYNDKISIIEEEGYYTGTYTQFRNAVNELSTRISNLDRRIASLSGSTDMSDVATRRRLEAERREYQSQLDELYRAHSNKSQLEAIEECIKNEETSRNSSLQKQSSINSNNLSKIPDFISEYGYKHNISTKISKATLSKNGSIIRKCTSTKCDYCKTTVIYKVSSIKLSKTSYTYNGKVKTPTVTVKDSAGKTLKNGTDYTVKYSSGRKNPGIYTVTVTFKGNYSGTKKLSFKIAPKAPTLKVTAGTKKASLSWSKQTGASGYVVYMATSKNGTYKKIATVKGSTKVSCTKTGLTKGKTYYFKVKAYKTVDGKNIYGAYSAVKSGKIK